MTKTKQILDEIYAEYGFYPPRWVLERYNLRPETKDLYVIQCNDRIKIGIAKNIDSRVQNLQVGNPYPLLVLLRVEYGEELEIKLHRKFRKYHARGEWFQLSKELYDWIEDIKEINSRNERKYQTHAEAIEARLKAISENK